jgi:hypothetical protein
MTITKFPESPTQYADIHRFLSEIYDEFRRQRLYNSTLLRLLQRLRENGELHDEVDYDYTEDADDHYFRNGPLPGDFTFLEFEETIRRGYAERGYQLWLVDVCEGQNIWNNWRLVLEII